MPPNHDKFIFSKVKIARELLREKAEDILREYLQTVSEARVAGDYESATKALQWLLEHMPTDEHGDALVSVSVDKKQQQIEKPTGPAIQIGIAVGGIGQKQIALKKPEELSAAVTEAEVLDE